MELIEKLKGDLRDYRSVPFWSWNDKLSKEELKRQIRLMKEQGMGGFFMHARGGLMTEYLSSEWFDAIRECIDEAKRLDMNAWAYDENGWPSGFCGMKLLKNPDNFAHYLKMEKRGEFDGAALGVYCKSGEKLLRVSGNIGAGEYFCLYDKANSSVVDVLNGRVVDEFILETHEKYYARFKNDFGKALMGFFTDEPQYFRWETAYTPVILAAYKDKYNEDLLEVLGGLFIDCEDCFKTRFRYHKLMNELFTTNFAKKIFDWCEAHNCRLTGHAVEESSLSGQMWCCAGVMPFYEYEHIPGIDWLGREIGNGIMPKQVGSVARQLGKKQVLTETFACSGWDVTPMELKIIAEWQYVGGVNLMCQHLSSYSIRGQRKRDYPLSFSEHTPWFKHMKDFNDYFARLGYIISNGEELCDVGVIHPMTSAYLTYNRREDYKSVEEIEKGFAELTEKLGSYQIYHHYIDEDILSRHGYVDKGELVVGKCRYKTIVFPKIYNLLSSTNRLIEQFAAEGGNIYFDDLPPKFVEGEKRQVSIKASISFIELLEARTVKSDRASGVRSMLLKFDNVKILYLVNLSKYEEKINFHITEDNINELDLSDLSIKWVNSERRKDQSVLPLDLSYGESKVIILGLNKQEAAVDSKPENKFNNEMNLSKKVKICGGSENLLTLDMVSYSYDGTNFSKKQPVPAVMDKLLSERTNRKVFLKYSFFSSKEIENVQIEFEDMNILSAHFNSVSAQYSRSGKIDRSFYTIDVKKLKVGENVLTLMIDFYEKENVYYVLYDAAEGTESLKNCLSFDTSIESAYVRGNFGVYSDSLHLEQNSLVSEGDFYIDNPSEAADYDCFNLSGYAFFAGTLEFSLDFEMEKTPVELVLKGRFAVAEIFLNDKFVDKLILKNSVPIADFLKSGKNTLKVRLTTGNRNLLGPHHNLECEPLAVSPFSFDMAGTWSSFKSPHYLDRYAFTKMGIDEIIIKY